MDVPGFEERGTDGQSALRRATHPAGLLDVMPGAWNRSEHPERALGFGGRVVFRMRAAFGQRQAQDAQHDHPGTG